MESSKLTRRGVLTGTLAVAGIGLGAAGNVTAHTTETASSHTDSITFGEIDDEGEWLVLHNEGSDDLDISGFQINFEFMQSVDQIRTFQSQYGATMIPAGGSITVATGAEPSQGGTPAQSPDVEFDYGRAVMRDDDSDMYAILDPAGNVVARSDQDRHGNGEETETPTDGGDEGDDADRSNEYHADLRGGAETHDVETDSMGMATFEVNEEGTQARYVLSVTDLCNATQAHIHLGEAGEDGPVVVWLYPEEGQEPKLIEGLTTGTLAEGVITEDDLVGEWEGASFEDVVATFEDGGSYVNVHTEAYPAGEIRGQITPMAE